MNAKGRFLRHLISYITLANAYNIHTLFCLLQSKTYEIFKKKEVAVNSNLQPKNQKKLLPKNNFRLLIFLILMYYLLFYHYKIYTRLCLLILY